MRKRLRVSPPDNTSTPPDNTSTPPDNTSTPPDNTSTPPDVMPPDNATSQIYTSNYIGMHQDARGAARMVNVWATAHGQEAPNVISTDSDSGAVVG